MVKLGDVAQIVSGGTPKSGVPEYWGGDIPWATPADLSKLNSATISKTIRTITEEGLAKSSAKVLPKHSVLLSSRAPIGHVAINTIPIAINQGFKSIIPGPNLNSSYIYHWLVSHKHHLEALGNGATFKELSKSTVEQLEIPLPPLVEQRRIAAILDASKLTKRKLIQQKHLLHNTRIAAFQTAIQDSKSTKRLGDISDWQSGGTPSRKNPEYFSGTLPWFSSGELNTMTISDSREKISELAIQETSAKLIPVGSLLLGMYDTAALKSSITEVEASCNQAVAFSKIPQESANLIYVYHAVQHVKKRQLEKRRGIRQKNLNLSIIRNIEIPWISLREQDGFSTLANHVSAQVQKIDLAITKSSELESSIITRAFRGEL